MPCHDTLIGFWLDGTESPILNPKILISNNIGVKEVHFLLELTVIVLNDSDSRCIWLGLLNLVVICNILRLLWRGLTTYSFRFNGGLGNGRC